MAKHTPGPWRFEQAEDRHIRAANEYGSLMCDAQYYPWVPSNDADWSLIAAAPDMLAELEYQLDRNYNSFEPDNQGASYRRLDALIRRAKGEV